MSCPNVASVKYVWRSVREYQKHGPFNFKSKYDNEILKREKEKRESSKTKKAAIKTQPVQSAVQFLFIYS